MGTLATLVNAQITRIHGCFTPQNLWKIKCSNPSALYHHLLYHLVIKHGSGNPLRPMCLEDPWFIHGFQMFPGCISHNMSGMGLAPPCRSCPQVPAQPALGRGRRRMRPEPSCWASCPLIFKDNLRRSVPNMVGKTK